MGDQKPSTADCVGCLHLVNGKMHAFIKELVGDCKGSKCGVQFIMTKMDAAVGWAAAHAKAVDAGGQGLTTAFPSQALEAPKRSV